MSLPRIVYLHGFRSSPQSRKARRLAATLAARGLAQHWRCLQLPVAPQEALAAARAAIGDARGDGLALIGSSLGGWYATVLAEALGCRAVLLNPAVHPARDLAVHLGRQQVFFTDDAIELTAAHLEQLRTLEVARISRPERYLLVAATGDTVLDWREMVARYPGAQQRVIAGSDHELTDFAGIEDEVLAFCGVTAANAGSRP